MAEAAASLATPGLPATSGAEDAGKRLSLGVSSKNPPLRRLDFGLCPVWERLHRCCLKAAGLWHFILVAPGYTGTTSSLPQAGCLPASADQTRRGRPGVRAGAAGLKALRSRPWRPPTPRFPGREKTEASRAAAAFCPLPSPPQWESGRAAKGPGPGWPFFLGCPPGVLSARPRSGTCPDPGHCGPPHSSMLRSPLRGWPPTALSPASWPPCPEPRPDPAVWEHLGGLLHSSEGAGRPVAPAPYWMLPPDYAATAG